MKRALALPVALAALSACTVGPDYRPRAARPAAAGAFQAGLAVDAAGQLPDRWWSLYADPQLDALVEEALRHNSDLRVAAANLERALAILGEQRAALIPSTEIDASATRERNQSTGQQPKTIYSAGFSLSYELDLFGRVRRSIEAARADAQSLAATRDATRVTVAAATTQAYFDVCLLGVRVDVARQSLDLVTSSYEGLRRQVALGVGTPYDIARQGVLVEQQRAAMNALDGLRAQSLYDLTRLLGRAATDVPPAALACRAAPKLARPIPIGDGAAMIRRRPDIRAAERTLAGSTALIGVATADLFPTITLGGGITATGTGLKSATSRQGVSFAVGPGLSWFFPNIVAARARVREAGAQARADLASFDGTVITALSEVEKALAGYDAEIRRNRSLAAAFENGQRAYTIALARVRLGSISQLELIDVQRDLVTTQSDLAESDAALGDDQVALFRALGGGWQDAPAIDPAPRTIGGTAKP